MHETFTGPGIVLSSPHMPREAVQERALHMGQLSYELRKRREDRYRIYS